MKTINIGDIFKRLGLNTTNLTMMDLLTRMLHLLPSLLKDGHCISFGASGIGKTTLITNSSNKFINITKLSSATLYGNKTTKEKGIISDDYNIAYFEQSSKISKIEDEAMGNLLTHCNGDDVRRVGEIYDNRTSIILLGNCEVEYTLHINKNKFILPKTFDKDFFLKFPDEIKEEQGLERFIILPSFLLDKITTDNTFTASNNSLKEEIDNNRMEFHKYDLGGKLSMREYKQQCKIITCLNYFLNSNRDLKKEDWIFESFKALAESITQLRSGSYVPFYYKNENGRRLALLLILDYLPNSVVIEEAHFLEHRALIKVRGKDIWYKIALDLVGKIENKIEYQYYMDKKSKNISEILELSSNHIIMKQRYIPLFSEFFAVKDFSFIYNDFSIEKEKYEKRIIKLEQDILIKDKQLEKQGETINSIIGAVYALKNNHTQNFYLPSRIEKHMHPTYETSEELIKILVNEAQLEFPILKSGMVKNRNIGKNDKKILFVNFFNLIASYNLIK